MSKNKMLRIKEPGDKIIHIVMLIIILSLAFACLYPFLLIVSASFQSQESIYEHGYRVISDQYTLDAYRMLLKDPEQLLNAYSVTIVSSILTTVIGVFVMSTCGYVMSREDYKYRKILSFYVFFTMLFNGGLVPTYIMLSKWFKLKNTIWVLVLPLCVSAWNIILMKGFFASIPKSLIECAKLDGAGEFRIFSSIVIPLAKPAFATISLFLLLGAWNDYMMSMLYIDNEAMIKLQYLLVRIMKNLEFLNSSEAIKYGVVQGFMDIPTLGARMAMCVLAAGPVLVAFPFFQKYFTRGLTVGSIKG